MSLHNDYLINTLVKQRHAELLDRAAEDRLAREMPGRSASWWRRLVDGWRRPLWRRPEIASTPRAARVRPSPVHSAPQP